MYNNQLLEVMYNNQLLEVMYNQSSIRSNV